jgi:hypothetical protein
MAVPEHLRRSLGVPSCIRQEQNFQPKAADLVQVGAAVRLHQTRRSSPPQHFQSGNFSDADIAADGNGGASVPTINPTVLKRKSCIRD